MLVIKDTDADYVRNEMLQHKAKLLYLTTELDFLTSEKEKSELFT